MSLPFSLPAGAVQLTVLLTLLLFLVKPLGLHIARVLSGERTFLSPLLLPIERIIYCLCWIDPEEGMTAGRYARAFLTFSLLCLGGLFGLLLAQDFPPVSPSLALNIAASFLTGTNWQAYMPETTLTNALQQFGLAVQNFLAAASGMAVLAALARSLAPETDGKTLGNFWVDVTRGTLYVLLPLALVLGIFLVSEGVVQTTTPLVTIHTLETGRESTLVLGPVASQAAIKQLGTNGGGFYAANGAHPLENPTPLSHFIQILALLLIPGALSVTFGKIVQAPRQGRLLLAVMLCLFVPAALFAAGSESAGNPFLHRLGVEDSQGNMEGKEVRFGVVDTTLMAVAAGGTSGGTASGAIDSFFPMTGATPLVLILLGEVVFGGVGSGLAVLLVFVLLTVFIASLMIGRTPEYLGKRIGVFEIKMASLVFLTPVFLILGGTGAAVLFDIGRAGATNPGAQGFSQIFYAFASATSGNGSALAGIAASSDFYNIALALVMLLGRFLPLCALLAIAGSLVAQRAGAPTRGALRTDSPLFGGLLLAIILTSAMAYVPALALGPMAEHVLMSSAEGP